MFILTSLRINYFSSIFLHNLRLHFSATLNTMQFIIALIYNTIQGDPSLLSPGEHNRDIGSPINITRR